MLLIKRKSGESLTIQPCEEMDSNMTVAEMLGQTPIQIVVERVAGDVAKVGVVAPSDLSICWDELYYRPGRVATPSQSLAKNTHVRQILGENIRHLRAASHLSGEALASKAGLPVTLLSAVELGVGLISLDELVRLATALEVNVIRLLQESVVSKL